MVLPVQIASVPSQAVLKTGQQTIGGSKVVLTLPLNDSVIRGVILKAFNTNSDTIYIGDSDVTTNVGFPLTAGESVVLPLNSMDVYAIADAASQKLAWAII